MEFEDVIRGRRMVRRFAPDPVEPAILERIALAARRAPSAGNAQGQRVVIVTDGDLRRRVGAWCDEDGYRDLGYGRWISEAPALFVPCVSEEVYHARYREPDKLDAGEEEDPWPVPYWWMDVGATALLIHLAAIDCGLAAGFAGPGERPPESLHEILAIPPDYVAVGVIPVGRGLDAPPSPSLARGRLALLEFARWNGW